MSILRAIVLLWQAWKWKRKLTRECYQQAWAAEIDANHQGQAIEDYEAIIDKADAQVKEKQARIEEIKDSHERALREENGRITKEIADLEKTKSDTARQLITIKTNVQNQRQKASYLRNRAKFIRNLPLSEII